VAKIGNAVFATTAIQSNPDFLLRRMQLACRAGMSFTICSAGAFVVTGFIIIFNSIWVKTKPKTSAAHQPKQFHGR
jgi:hypothetical protein